MTEAVSELKNKSITEHEMKIAFAVGGRTDTVLTVKDYTFQKLAARLRQAKIAPERGIAGQRLNLRIAPTGAGGEWAKTFGKFAHGMRPTQSAPPRAIAIRPPSPLSPAGSSVMARHPGSCAKPPA